MPIAVTARPPSEQLAFESSASAQMERLLSDLGRMYRERNVALQALESAHHEALIRLAVAAELRDDTVHAPPDAQSASTSSGLARRSDAHASFGVVYGPQHEIASSQTYSARSSRRLQLLRLLVSTRR